MAAIVLDKNFQVNPLDFCNQLYTKCSRHLPSYARPLFIRIMQNIPVTETFKHKKSELSKQVLL